jgi:protein AbiQ
VIKIRTLNPAFHQQFPDLKEILHDKRRGYGVVTITISNLTFGIPVRTNLRHNHSIVLDTVIRAGFTYKRGLDFTKAVIITDSSTQLGTTFHLDNKQLQKLHKNGYKIKKKFNTYVNRYVEAVKNNTINTLQGSAYKYSTLVNYHNELGV